MSKKASAKASSSAPSEGKSSGKHLVIVESPAKAKTINKYLGNDYIVKASMGHVRDLPLRAFGVEVEKNFEPTYRVLPTRKKVVDDLTAAAKKCDMVYLATDLDREGEAIAWHLQHALKLPDERVERVIFNEITKRAITNAFKEPHRVDMDKVNAQQARRILDRIVGYQLSPLLWRKIAKGLSAGRVQSVAVKLIVERESEIAAFTPEEYWSIEAILHAGTVLEQAKAAWLKYCKDYGEKPDARVLKQVFEQHHLIKAELIEFDGKKFSADNQTQANEIYASLNSATYRIESLATKMRNEKPPAPFTTATLQQQAATRLKFSTARTMRIAQQLYEGVDVGSEG